MAKRKLLNFQQKLEIIRDLENGAKNTDVCRKYGLPSSSVSTMWKDKNKILNAIEDGSHSFKRARKCGKVDLDAALVQWLKREGKNMRINGPILRAQAEKLAVELGYENFSCSNGWLYRFRLRHSVRFTKSTDSLDPADEWLNNVWKDLKGKYSDDDVYVAHEIGMFFNATPAMVPDLNDEKCTHGELNDERLTIFLCCNVNGTDKRPLVVVGNAPDFSFSSYRTGLPVTYTYNTSSWMTADIFESTMFLWDNELHLSGKQILLLLTTSEVHTQLKSLENIRLCFLPEEASSRLPFNFGITRSFRHAYRREMVLKFIQALETDDVLRIPLVDAISCLCDSWESVTSEMVRAAFCQAGFIDDDCSSPSESLSLTEWLKLQNKTVPVKHLDDYEFIDEDIATSGCVMDADVKVETDEFPNVVEETIEEPPVEPITIDDARDSLQILRSFFDQHSTNVLTFNALGILHSEMDAIVQQLNGVMQTE